MQLNVFTDSQHMIVSNRWDGTSRIKILGLDDWVNVIFFSLRANFRAQKFEFRAKNFERI